MSREQMSIFYAGDSPVRICPSRAIVAAWTEIDPGCGLSFIESLRQTAPPGSLSRTSLGSCRPTEGGTLESSSGRWLNAGMGSLGEFWTLDISESPNAGAECSLSEVLESEPVPRKYYLSRKACAGILRRAKNRGATIPTDLIKVLRAHGRFNPDLGVMDGEGQ